MIPVILSTVIMASGLVADFAHNSALLAEHDRRITQIELNYVPRQEHDERDKLAVSQQAENSRRLDQIETKLDMILAQGRIIKTK